MTTRFSTRHPLILITIALITLSFSSIILIAQFHGEDEVGVYITGSWLAEALSRGNWVSFFSILVGSYHPPGRFLLAAVSFLLFGPSIVALRVPAVILWVATCVLAADITRRKAGQLAPPLAGLVTGVLLGASGLFSVEALGFGHGVATFSVMLFLWFKTKRPTWNLDTSIARYDYLIGGFILAAGFLWFTSLLPIAGLYHLYYGWQAIKKKDLAQVQQYILLSVPFLFFYAAYYLIFLGLPQYAVTHGIRERAVGQLHQNIARSQSAELNIGSFIENLRGLNWYHLPFVSWALLLLGGVGQWLRSRQLFWLLFPYALLFSFYIVDNTTQHFLSYYIWLLPFAVAFLWQWGSRGGRDSQRAVICLLVACCVGAAGFGYVTSIRQYSEARYPYNLEEAVVGRSKWRTNLVRPLPEIANDLAHMLGPTDHWTTTIDGTLPLYYWPDTRYVSVTLAETTSEHGPCLLLTPLEPAAPPITAVVHSQQQLPLCDSLLPKVIRYPESYLEILTSTGEN